MTIVGPMKIVLKVSRAPMNRLLKNGYAATVGVNANMRVSISVDRSRLWTPQFRQRLEKGQV